MSAYAMAATVDFGLDAKQGLLDLRSENARLRLVTRLFRAAPTPGFRRPRSGPGAVQRPRAVALSSAVGRRRRPVQPVSPHGP